MQSKINSKNSNKSIERSFRFEISEFHRKSAEITPLNSSMSEPFNQMGASLKQKYNKTLSQAEIKRRTKLETLEEIKQRRAKVKEIEKVLLKRK